MSARPPLLGPNAEAQRLLARMPLAKLRAAADARELAIPTRATRAELANLLVLHSMQAKSEVGYRETGNPYDSREAAYGPIAKLVARGRKRHVVDVGCGAGMFAATLRDEGVLGEDGTYVGLDISPAAIELAAQRVGGDLRFAFHTADAAALASFVDARTDAIVVSFVVTFLDTRAVHDLFASAARAAPGATMIVALTFRSAVDRLDGVEENEKAELAQARRYLRGDRKAARGVWDTSRFEHYRRSFETFYAPARRQILNPNAQVVWVGRPRGMGRGRQVRRPLRRRETTSAKTSGATSSRS